MSWVGPALGAAFILGGIAYVRHRTLAIKQGDHVAFRIADLGAPIAFPPEVVPQGNTQIVMRVDQVTPQGLTGYVVGYIDQAGNPQLPLGGGAGGAQMPVPVPQRIVTGLFRGNPPRRVS